MEKPSKKQKKVILIVGVTGAVYISFKYLLPLVIPFLVAYGIALALKPSALWLQKKLHLPLGLIGGIQVFLILVLLGILLYVGGRKLCQEANLLFDNLPIMIRKLDKWLTGACRSAERTLHLKDGFMVTMMRDMIRGMGSKAKSTAMPFLMVNTMTLCKILIQVSVITVILFIASILSLQEMESLKERRENSSFHKEFALISNRLVVVGNAYLKTQGSIIILTTVICIVGLMILKNPYYIILGICIGILDALPIFGTGTVFIPWAIVSFLTKQWKYGVGLVILYVICYCLREFMEAKIMGDKVGLSPLETLISMYVGLQLFGLLGFVLGPIGLLIVEDVVNAYTDG